MPPAERQDQSKLASGRLNALGAAIHPDRLASRLDASLSPATLSRLQKSPRLQGRLAALLLADGFEAEEGAWAPDLLSGNAPRRVALLVGGIWHARSLLKLISGQDLALLAERVGPEVQSFAIRHIGQAVASELIGEPERLARLIEQDGHGCLGAWLEGVSASERSRVLLRLPVGTAAESPTDAHREAAGPLVALVLARLAAEGAAA